MTLSPVCCHSADANCAVVVVITALIFIIVSLHGNYFVSDLEFSIQHLTQIRLQVHHRLRCANLTSENQVFLSEETLFQLVLPSLLSLMQHE